MNKLEQLINQIKSDKDLYGKYNEIRDRIFLDGPISSQDLEILSYIKLYNADFFKKIQNEILNVMGIYYKKPVAQSLKSCVFDIHSNLIKDKYGDTYTPMQVNIIDKIENNIIFSFSASTSTGKSFVFRHLIQKTTKDIAIIVPSRALINEYYISILNTINDKSVNILTFVDCINTKHARRNILILTPERSRELFKYKSQFNFEFILFDEAQIGDEESVRGIYFDSIVRRIQKAFPKVKCIFAHPFIINPDAQIKKNKFNLRDSFSKCYQQKNIGQIFYAHDEKSYYHFFSDANLYGRHKVLSELDPVEVALDKNKSILIYTTKNSIIKQTIFSDFEKYINRCETITNPEAKELIEELEMYIGANKDYRSKMIENLNKGIVIHHGSLPLEARIILEKFTKNGFCKICFATSTLEQGINMPFDVVYLATFPRSKSLALKNIIGRAGRTTTNGAFDYGCVIVKKSNMADMRQLLSHDEMIEDTSKLDVDSDELDDDYREFKDAINNNNFNDEYNLTNTEIERLTQIEVEVHIKQILDILFVNNEINYDYDSNVDKKSILYDSFYSLYNQYLHKRELNIAEKNVLKNAIKILMWKIEKKGFKQICWSRYAYAAQLSKRKELIRKGFEKEANELKAKFIRGYDDLPNSKLHDYSLFPIDTKAKDVDYDRIVFDTFDYLDKLIGFKLGDLFFAIFHKFFKKSDDKRAGKLALYFKYGTADDVEIMMLRYGLTFEQIEYLKKHIFSIDENEIIFKKSIYDLPKSEYKKIEKLVNIIK